jgi:hypothetical protein
VPPYAEPWTNDKKKDKDDIAMKSILIRPFSSIALFFSFSFLVLYRVQIADVPFRKQRPSVEDSKDGYAQYNRSKSIHAGGGAVPSAQALWCYTGG